MPDNKYCYPNSNVLINKLNITNQKALFEAEKELTAIRLRELQENPIKGKYDFAHLKSIHKYIFQDIYAWAGKERTVEIGKGNLFCTTYCIPEYAKTVFAKYFSQCYENKDNFTTFVRVFADNYGDLNALHPFREGNGRAQREFARIVCMECGYDFDLSCSTHQKMLAASKLSFDKGDSSLFIDIFSQAITSHESKTIPKLDNSERLSILTSDDLFIDENSKYDCYSYSEYEKIENYNTLYKEKINQMSNSAFKQEDIRCKIKRAHYNVSLNIIEQLQDMADRNLKPGEEVKAEVNGHEVSFEKNEHGNTILKIDGRNSNPKKVAERIGANAMALKTQMTQKMEPSKAIGKDR